MSVLNAVCPQCGLSYCGWALSNPLERKCGKCGSDLVISPNDRYVENNHFAPLFIEYKIPSYKKERETILGVGSDSHFIINIG
jgi:transcription initiation factor IIE alpha subunit